jgi:hypothetical protein
MMQGLWLKLWRTRPLGQNESIFGTDSRDKAVLPQCDIPKIADPLGKSVKRPSTPLIVSGEAA